MDKVKVLIADDHQIVIDGLKLVLNSHDNIVVTAEAHNGREVLHTLEATSVDCIVMDINMPEMDGITCARQVKKLHPNVKIVILTMYAQKSFVEEIIKIGIDGCLLKNNSAEELASAITRVVGGQSYYDHIKSFSSKEEEVKQYKLTDRELAIIKCLAEGLSSPEIADKLFISVHTARTHRKNILRKLDMHNSAELVQYAMANNII